MYLVLDLNLATFQYTGGFGFNHFCLTRIGIDDTLIELLRSFRCSFGSAGYSFHKSFSNLLRLFI